MLQGHFTELLLHQMVTLWKLYKTNSLHDVRLFDAINIYVVKNKP